MKENKYKIGKILREYRQKNRYTQEQLAEAIGVTPGFLGQIERDETYPSIDNLTKIIHVLDIDANTIFHPQAMEEESETAILVNEFKIQFTKLSKNNQEIITLLMKKMAEQQKREA